MKEKENETNEKQNNELFCKDRFCRHTDFSEPDDFIDDVTSSDPNLRNSEIEPLVLDKYPVNGNDCPDNLNVFDIFNIFDEPIFDEPIRPIIEQSKSVYFNIEQKINDTRTGLTINQKTEIHTLINNLINNIKLQIRQFRDKYEYLKYFYHGNKISDTKLEKTLEIYSGRLSKFSINPTMVFGSEIILKMALNIEKNAYFSFLTNKAKLKIFQIIDEILEIWENKRIPKSQRSQLIIDVISYFQDMVKRPVYESTISSIIFKGIDANPSNILKFIRNRVVQKDQINLQRTMELIYYSAILTPDLIYERSAHKFQVSDSDIEIFAKKVRERITQQI